MEIFLGIDYILQAFFFCLVDEMLQEARIFLYVITAEVVRWSIIELVAIDVKMFSTE